MADGTLHPPSAKQELQAGSTRRCSPQRVALCLGHVCLHHVVPVHEASGLKAALRGACLAWRVKSADAMSPGGLTPAWETRTKPWLRVPARPSSGHGGHCRSL